MDIKVDHNTVVVFDLDDTLYNELDYLKSAYKSIAMFLEPHEWKLLYVKMFSLHRSKINVFEYVANSYNTKVDFLIDMYRNHQPNIQLFDGVLDVFNAIKYNNGKIGIITDGRSNTQRAKLESLGIINDIDIIVISDEIGSEKPNVANFKAVEDAFTDASKFYYIADNLKKDFISPNALGWKSVGLIDNGMNIHFEGHCHSYKERLPIDFIIDFKELVIM